MQINIQYYIISWLEQTHAGKCFTQVAVYRHLIDIGDLQYHALLSPRHYLLYSLSYSIATLHDIIIIMWYYTKILQEIEIA